MQPTTPSYPLPAAAAPGGPASANEAAKLQRIRARVREMLMNNPNYQKLDEDKRRAMAFNTVNVLNFIGEDAAMPLLGGAAAPAPALAPAPARAAPQARGFANEPFRAQAAREGAAVAGALMDEVNFVEFVKGLIENVYVAIVEATMNQMEKFGELVASVAKSVDDFQRDNISQNQGRDAVVDQFPDLFEITTEGDFFGEGEGEPKVRTREGIDEDLALQRVRQVYSFRGEPPNGLDSDTLEQIIVPAAQYNLALSRQRLLATTLLMGLQKIVVTDGRIQAKVLYNFKSQDNYASHSRAENYDYGDQYRFTSDRRYASGSDGSTSNYSRGSDGSANSTAERGKSWARGRYRSKAEPVIKMRSVTDTMTEGDLTAAAQLAGAIDIKFKSETVDLNKIADSIQMGQIQGASGMMSAAHASSGQAAQQPPDNATGAGGTAGSAAPAGGGTQSTTPAAQG